MTTTGGPDQSFADPASSEQRADDPVVIDRGTRLDGDDIVVEPDVRTTHPRRRTRALVVGAVVVVLVAAGTAVALASRDSGPGTSSLRSAAPARPPSARPTRNRAVRPKPAKPAHPRVGNVRPKRVRRATPASSPTPVIATPPAAAPPASPPAATPAAQPTSVLQWQATPGALSIKAGGHATLTIDVVNPTDGTVTLPHPLSCAPTLRGPKGHVIGFAVCVEMAQVMSAHDHLTQQYTIYATDTAAAGGGALAPGAYTASVENLFDVNVTVTAP